MKMRAKLVISHIKTYDTYDELEFNAVSKCGYLSDGSDENNTYAKWTPFANLKMAITNPVLMGNFKTGQEFYVDFSLVEEK